MGFFKGNDGGGSSEWSEDGNGNIIPSDGENIGDGTTTAVHQSLSAEQIQSTFYTSPRGTDGGAIQSALDDAVGGWAKVVIDSISSDPYLVGASAPLTIPSKTIVEVREHVKLADSTAENVFQNRNFDDPSTSADDDHIYVVGQGGLIDGNMANQSSDTTRTYIYGRYQNGVSLFGVENFGMHNLNIVNCRHSGIVLGGATNGVVTENYVSGDYIGGIQSEIDHENVRPNKNVTISDNTVNGGGLRANQSAGIYVSGVVRHTVDGNIVRGRDNNGITVYTSSEGEPTEHITVSDNTVEDCAQANSSDGRRGGIQVYTLNTGGTMRNIVVAANTVDHTGVADNDQRGILAQSSGPTVEDLTINNNTVRSHHTAILIEDNGSIEAVEIVGNYCVGGANSSGYGIYANSLSRANIATNVCHDCGASGIGVININKSPENVVVTGNLCYDNGSSAVPYGIRVFSATNVFVATNRCFDTGSGTQTHGIYSDSGSSGCVYLLNDLRGNATAGHNLQGSNRITDAVGQGTAEDWNIT